MENHTGIMIDRASSSYAVAVAAVMRSVAIAVLLLHRATLICAHRLEGWSWLSILHHIRDYPAVSSRELSKTRSAMRQVEVHTAMQGTEMTLKFVRYQGYE